MKFYHYRLKTTTKLTASILYVYIKEIKKFS